MSLLCLTFQHQNINYKLGYAYRRRIKTEEEISISPEIVNSRKVNYELLDKRKVYDIYEVGLKIITFLKDSVEVYNEETDKTTVTKIKIKPLQISKSGEYIMDHKKRIWKLENDYIVAFPIAFKYQDLTIVGDVLYFMLKDEIRLYNLKRDSHFALPHIENNYVGFIPKHAGYERFSAYDRDNRVWKFEFAGREMMKTSFRFPKKAKKLIFDHRDFAYLYKKHVHLTYEYETFSFGTGEYRTNTINKVFPADDIGILQVNYTSTGEIYQQHRVAYISNNILYGYESNVHGITTHSMARLPKGSRISNLGLIISPTKEIETIPNVLDDMDERDANEVNEDDEPELELE